MRALVLLALFACVASAQTLPHFHFTEQPGPHAVGLKVVEQYDYTRTFHSPPTSLANPTLASALVPSRLLSGTPPSLPKPRR